MSDENAVKEFEYRGRKVEIESEVLDFVWKDSNRIHWVYIDGRLRYTSSDLPKTEDTSDLSKIEDRAKNIIDNEQSNDERNAMIEERERRIKSAEYQRTSNSCVFIRDGQLFVRSEDGEFSPYPYEGK